MKIIFTAIVFIFSSVLCFAQVRSINGQVRNQRGEPIPMATITVQGTKLSTTANERGLFTISVNGNQKLVVSASGHQAKTVPADGDNLNITLNESDNQLSEVVVTTALGIRRESKELGYAATSIGNKLITQGKAVNVQQALNGKISGVDITTTNSSVFENAKINIRGIRSLTGNNQPLLVVDGAPTPLSFLYSIPPDDVQDLTVLKSGASAAIYGPDAVNGVIIVTTKKGGSDKLSVSVNTTIQLARVAYFPKLQKSFGQGAGEIVDQYGNYGHVPYENQQYGPAFDGSIKNIGVRLQDGTIQSGPYNNAHYHDKVDFWNTGLTVQNSISVTGQDFYASVEDANVKGLTPDDRNRRTSFRFNGGRKSGKFSINYGLNYVLQNYDIVNEAGFANLFPSAYNGSIFFLVMQTASNIPLTSYKDWQNNKFAQYSNYYNEYAVNPYWVIGNIRSRGRTDNLIGNMDLAYQIFPWLKASARVSTNLSFNNNDNTQAPVVVSDWAHANRAPTQYSNVAGNVFNDENYTSRINVDYFLDGQKAIKDFTVRYLAGGNLRQNRSKDVAAGGNNLVVPNLFNVGVRSGDANVPAYPFYNYNIEQRQFSFYGDVGLGYKNWAFVEFTGRNDWDSRLLKQNRSFFYPGANASILLSDALTSLKNSNIFSYVKLRGAYSKSGNVNIGVYSLEPTYSQPVIPGGFNGYPTGFPYGNTVGFSANQVIPSPDLKPEFVYTKELGVELGFLKNRIDFQATYFNQDCRNQILQVSQSWTTGYSIGLANAANFKNYGVEMDLGLSPLIKVGKGRIDIKLNATYNDNEVTSTFNNIPVVIGGTLQPSSTIGGSFQSASTGFIQVLSGSPTANNIAVVGRPAFSFQLTDYERDPQGRVVVDPVTGYPIKANDLIIKGRTLPLWVVGFTPSYSLGGFSVSMTWDYKTGHDFYSGLGVDEDFAGISARSAEYGRQRFVFPNSVYKDASGKFVPNTNIMVQDGNAGFWTSAVNTTIATNYFASAAAIRLREVNITYNLPLKLIGNGKVIKRLSVSAIGRNLLLLVPASNQWGDPEFNFSSSNNTSGLSSSFQSPSARFYGGSLTVQF